MAPKQEPAPLRVLLATTDIFASLAVEYGIAKEGEKTIDRAERIGKTENVIDKEAARRFEETQLRPWLLSCGYDVRQACGRICLGLLYGGMANALVDNRTGSLPLAHARVGFWAGTKNQRLMLDGLSAATPEERRDFMEEARTLPATHQYVLTYCSGAFSALRVYQALAHCELLLGRRIGTLYEDTVLSTDFVVTSRRAKGGCIVQVKTADPGAAPFAYTTEANRPSGVPTGLYKGVSLQNIMRVWEEAYRRRVETRDPWDGLIVLVDPWAIPTDAVTHDAVLAEVLREQLQKMPAFAVSSSASAAL